MPQYEYIGASLGAPQLPGAASVAPAGALVNFSATFTPDLRPGLFSFVPTGTNDHKTHSNSMVDVERSMFNVHFGCGRSPLRVFVVIA